MSFSCKKIILLCVLFFCVLPLAQAKQPVGTVVSISGKVWAQKSTQKRALSIKSPVMEKDRLTTGKNGRVQILFADDSILSLAPATTVTIKSFSFARTKSPNMALHIAKGITRMVSGKIVAQHPEGFKISSPLATIGIRGTITVHDVKQKSEQHFVELLGKGHDVWIQGHDGKTVKLASSLVGVDLRQGEPTPDKGRPMTWQEQKRVKTILQQPVPAPDISPNDNTRTEQNNLREDASRTTHTDFSQKATQVYEWDYVTIGPMGSIPTYKWKLVPAGTAENSAGKYHTPLGTISFSSPPPPPAGVLVFTPHP